MKSPTDTQAKDMASQPPRHRSDAPVIMHPPTSCLVSQSFVTSQVRAMDSVRDLRNSRSATGWPSLSGEALMSRIGKTWLVWIVGIALVACTDPTQPATAVQLAFIVQPSDATAGTAINPDVAVAIQDRSGNLVTSATDVVRLTVDSNASGGSLAGTASVPAVNGVATFSNVRIVTAGRGHTLKPTRTPVAPRRRRPCPNPPPPPPRPPP